MKNLFYKIIFNLTLCILIANISGCFFLKKNGNFSVCEGASSNNKNIKAGIGGLVGPDNIERVVSILIPKSIGNKKFVDVSFEAIQRPKFSIYLIFVDGDENYVDFSPYKKIGVEYVSSFFYAEDDWLKGDYCIAALYEEVVNGRSVMSTETLLLEKNELEKIQ